MIAAEQIGRALKREGEVIGGVTGRVHGLKREAVDGDAVAIAENDIRLEGHIGAFGKGICLAGKQRAGLPVRPETGDRRSGFGLEPAGHRRMVVMGMGDGDETDLATADGGKPVLQMTVDLRAGIDDDQFVAADEIAIGAVKGERRRVFRRQPGNALGKRHGAPIGRIEFGYAHRISFNMLPCLSDIVRTKSKTIAGQRVSPTKFSSRGQI